MTLQNYLKFLFLLILAPSISIADSIAFGGFSKHDEIYGELNEIHPSFIYQTEKYETGFYRNSFDKWSRMAAIKRPVHKDWFLRIGVADNYPIRLGFLPIAQAVYSSNNYDISLGMITVVSFKVNI